MEIGANDVLVPIMYGIASAMGGPQVFEALLPMLEGDFRQMDASSFAALRENLDSLNITAQQRKALLQLLSSGVADICAQSQATTLANLEALLQELKALNPDRSGGLLQSRSPAAGSCQPLCQALPHPEPLGAEAGPAVRRGFCLCRLHPGGQRRPPHRLRPQISGTSDPEGSGKVIFSEFAI